MTVMTGGPAVPTRHEINAGFEAEWQAGYDTGYAGQPVDPWEHGQLFSRYGDSPQGRLQQAAFSRGHIQGGIDRRAERSRQRVAA